ncbi:MAG: hypothetical protein ACOZIN_19570 [Myxococcota bacterium]
MLLAVLLNGCTELNSSNVEQGSEALRPAGGSKTSSSYALRTTAQKSTKPTWQSSFPINSTYDVHFAFEVPSSVKGHHVATVFVFMPNLSTYQRFDLPFATDVAASSGEQQAQKLSTGYRVWASMPVAGTIIEQYSLTGDWRADAYLDGASTVAAKASFSLQ